METHVIQRILGHAQVSITRICTDPTDPLTREAVDRIGRTLRPDDADADPASRAGHELRKALTPLDRDTAPGILRNLLAENGAGEAAPREQMLTATRNAKPASACQGDTKRKRQARFR